ncbi:MAG: MFS transporter [Actinomycetota bacterium]
MTDTRPTARSSRFVPGRVGFIAVLSACMAVTALGVDTVLPAYDEIRDSLGLEPDATAVTGLVTAYLAGNSLGLLPAGLLADRFGRRAVMWGGLGLYVAFAVASIYAGSLGLMILTRFCWGLASAAPRVAALAMVRDAFVGDQMAKQMSLVMAMFLLVPAVAPSLSAGILAVSGWQAVFWMCAAAAAAVAVAVTSIPETLATDQRRPLNVRAAGRGILTVLRTPGTAASIAALTALFGAFMAYLAGAELIIDQTYDLADWFPVFFGGTALVMLSAMLINSRLVERIGLDRLIDRLSIGMIGITAAVLAVTFATDGAPPFWAFVLGISAVLMLHQMMIPNLTAAAMRPLGEMAGTGAAVVGAVSGGVGAVLAEVVNSRFDETARPLMIGFFAAALLARFFWRRVNGHLAVSGAEPSTAR